MARIEGASSLASRMIKSLLWGWIRRHSRRRRRRRHKIYGINQDYT